MIGSGIDMAWAIFCGGLSLVWLVALSWIALRMFGHRGGDGLGRARALLNRRLAAGEIDVEEYYERESALRDAQPTPRPRRRLL
jgi:uncharacterized membrane protein